MSEDTASMGVFLTDGDQRATLAVARALGQAGVEVTVGHTAPTSLAASSRYCTRAAVYPSPWTDPAGFQEFLLREMRTGRYRLLLPMTDVTAQLAAALAERLPRGVTLPLPAADVVHRAQDKREVLRVARSLGIATPATWMLDEDENIEEVAQQVRYPVVIKPAFSRFLRNGQWVTGPVEFAHDAGELLERYRASAARIPRPLVQERIEGDGCGVFLLLWHGERKAAFCHRRLREKPPWGGVSVLRESVAPDAELVEQSFRLLEALGWHGPAMVEFKRDTRDARARLMEINGRFWGSLQLAIDAGLDFPRLLWRLACGEEAPAQFDYRAGVQSRWLLGDLDHLLLVLRHPRAANGMSTAERSRWRACAQFLKFYRRNMYYEVERLSDLRPAWFELRSWVRQALAPREEGQHAR